MSLNPAPLGNKKNKKGQNKYHQGKFFPQNSMKYIGNTPILYRSSWEFAFCKWCDMNDKVNKWSTESLEIPYQLVNGSGNIENHRYLPDFYVEMTTNEQDKYERLIIELKPLKETIAPTQPIKQTQKILENYYYSVQSFKKNLFKWHFAKDWCEKRHMKFVIVTEEDLKKRGIITNDFVKNFRKQK